MWDNQLENNSLTVVKELEKGIFDTVLIDHLMKKGRHHWELTVEKIQFPDNLLLGVASLGINLQSNPLESGLFWGIQPLMSAKKRQRVLE